MTREEFINNNVLIAKFMGWRLDYSFPDKGRVYRSPQNYVELDTTLKFNYDWNWLMSVVEKIKEDPNVDITIYNNSCKINISEDNKFKVSIFKMGSTKESVWFAIVEYINKYVNENIKEN